MGTFSSDWEYWGGFLPLTAATCLKRPDVTICDFFSSVVELISSSIPDQLECSCGNIWVWTFHYNGSVFILPDLDSMEIWQKFTLNSWNVPIPSLKSMHLWRYQQPIIIHVYKLWCSYSGHRCPVLLAFIFSSSCLISLRKMRERECCSLIHLSSLPLRAC